MDCIAKAIAKCNEDICVVFDSSGIGSTYDDIVKVYRYYKHRVTELAWESFESYLLTLDMYNTIALEEYDCKYNRKHGKERAALWNDRIKANYRAHYNNKYVLELPTVKITQNASLIGRRMKTNDTFEYQTKLNAMSDDTKYVRSITESDYFFRPKFETTKDGTKQVLLKVKNSRGKLTENPTVDYVPYYYRKELVLCR